MYIPTQIPPQQRFCLLPRGTTGDCYLCAVAASVAYVDPEKIKNIMVDLHVHHSF